MTDILAFGQITAGGAFETNAGCGFQISCSRSITSHSVTGMDRTQTASHAHCTRVLVRRGGFLYKVGARFDYIYTIVRGAFKGCTTTPRGEEQVTGFYMRGGILGLDALGSGHHAVSVMAIEDSEVCLVAAHTLEQVCAMEPGMANRIRAALAREIDERRRLMITLGRKTAEERVATFLVELAHRHLALGQSTCDMKLVLKRREIGSYLGITLETVSRVFSTFQQRQLIELNRKQVSILDFSSLARLTGERPGMFA